MISTEGYKPHQISDLVPEKDKLKPEYLIGNIKYNIGSLVRSKPDLRLAYNYYHGIRNKEEFEYLTDNYGLGTSCELEFIPLMRKYIQVLKGQFVNNPLKYHVTSTDAKTIEDTFQIKQYAILEEVMSRATKQLKENIDYIKKSREGLKVNPPKSLLEQAELQKLQDYYDTHWVSHYEISAQHVLDYLLSSASLDFRTKMESLFEDLLVSGTGIYRGKLDFIGEDPDLEIINPLHFFYNKNTNDPYISQCTRVVHRFYKTPEELVNMFGDELSKEEIERLYNYKSNYGTDLYLQPFRYDIENITGFNHTYNDYYSDNTSSIIECYYTEWLANNIVESDDEDFEFQALQGQRYGDKVGKKKGWVKMKLLVHKISLITVLFLLTEYLLQIKMDCLIL